MTDDRESTGREFVTGHSDWTETAYFAADGLRIGLRSNCAEVFRDEVLPHVPPTWRRTRATPVDEMYSLTIADQGMPPGAVSQSPGEHTLHAEIGRSPYLDSSPDLDRLLNVLESELHVQTAVRARRSLFVHAGVVGWRDHAIVIPGRSMSGKSTLVAALVHHGATYYSDEYAVFDRNGLVHAYPKRLSLRADGGEYGVKCTAKELGGQVGRRALPVGLVMVTSYRRGGHWAPEPLSKGQALLALLANTPLARSRPSFLLAVLRAAVSSAHASQTGRGNAEEVAAELLQLSSNSFGASA